MLNTFGNQKQFQFLRNTSNKCLIRLDSGSLKELVNTEFLSISEKLEILELSLGLRFLTEASDFIKYSSLPRKDSLKYPSEKSINELRGFLERKLPFPIKISKRKSKRLGICATEINIFANQALKDYFDKFEKNITDLEIGILYGFNPKAVLAFCGYIESCPPPKITKAYQYYNSKVFAKDFIKEIDDYHLMKWKRLKVASPELIEMAEEEFNLRKNKKMNQ